VAARVRPSQDQSSQPGTIPHHAAQGCLVSYSNDIQALGYGSRAHQCGYMWRVLSRFAGSPLAVVVATLICNSDHQVPGNRLLWKIVDAAAQLGISRSKLYELISRGEISAVHIDRSVRIPGSELEAFVSRLRGERDLVPGTHEKNLPEIGYRS
jgi:excisionase family DNA binding protein